MIIGFAFLGIGFSTLDIVVRPIMHSYNGCFLYFSLEGIFQSSRAITEVLLAIYSAVYSSILSFLTVQYIFRTCLVMKPNLAEYFRGWRCVFWLGYVYVFGFAWGFITYVYAFPDKYARDYVREEMYEQYKVDSYNIPLFVLLAYGERNETKFVRFQSLICIFGDMGIMTLQYVIMMTCGVLLYKKITSNLREAEAVIAFSQVHKQFFKALMYQNDEEDRREIRWNSVACIASVTALLTFQYLVMLTSGFIMYRRTQSTTTTSSHQENLQRQFFIALIYQVVAPTVFFQFPAFFVLTAPFFDFKLSWIKLVARELFEIMGGPSPRNPPTSTTVSHRLAGI
ncbi:hypothetical protein CAEBREN_09229 [Caenorhabditis brenneri]|uniref:Uncharacterized protein n=1 Tax=Caenorhabditis brenneri TaxID=135651 RepID=G0NYZ8_CAEBE|nr:hypothetical protein CAEBREN_09229 [Caenorhabditis brenneri]